MSEGADQIHVHAINDPLVSAELFHYDADLILEVCERDDELKGRVTASVSMGGDDLEQVARDTDVLIAFRYPHRELMAASDRLRWIHQVGSGIEHLLPLDWLPDGVKITNSRGVHAPKAGEFVASAVLLLNNHIPHHVTSQREHRWDQVFSDCIEGKTLVVIGTGEMGRAGIKWAGKLGLKIIGVNRSGTLYPGLDEVYTIDDLSKVLPQADFLLLTVPQTEKTLNLIGEDELASMKKGASLINMARAGVVDYTALAASLGAGHLSGAVLDVFDPEPFPADSDLWDCPNLIMTPHVSSDPLDYKLRVLDLFADNLKRFTKGEELRNEVRPEDGY